LLDGPAQLPFFVVENEFADDEHAHYLVALQLFKLSNGELDERHECVVLTLVGALDEELDVEVVFLDETYFVFLVVVGEQSHQVSLTIALQPATRYVLLGWIRHYGLDDILLYFVQFAAAFDHRVLQNGEFLLYVYVGFTTENVDLSVVECVTFEIKFKDGVFAEVLGGGGLEELAGPW